MKSVRILFVATMLGGCGGAPPVSTTARWDDAAAREVRTELEKILTRLKKMGGSVKVEKRLIDCRAVSMLGHCALEFDFVALMPDGQKVIQPSRATGVMRRGQDGWKWAHWHTSLSQMPAPAAPSPASAPKD